MSSCRRWLSTAAGRPLPSTRCVRRAAASSRPPQRGDRPRDWFNRQRSIAVEPARPRRQDPRSLRGSCPVASPTTLLLGALTQDAEHAGPALGALALDGLLAVLHRDLDRILDRGLRAALHAVAFHVAPPACRARHASVSSSADPRSAVSLLLASSRASLGLNASLDGTWKPHDALPSWAVTATTRPS